MYNTNPQVTRLLSWHGHDVGGVSVPFQSSGSPLGSRVATPLIVRLRTLAADVANSSTEAPRWIFLVGGPGNGKSETVQDFLEHLDVALGYAGTLVSVLREKFQPDPIVHRRVEVVPGDFTQHSDDFETKIGKLIVVQDATSSDDAFGDSARQLAFDLVDLVTSGDTPRPLLVVCANRGLLARTVNAASTEFGPNNEVTQLLEQILRASSLGLDALTQHRTSCWPIDSPFPAACWPMDLDSLLSEDATTGAFESMLQLAVMDQEWDATGRCGDCDARDNCPFNQNSRWLRAMLAIVIAAGLPNSQREPRKKMSEGNPPIARLHIEDIHDQVPDDYLECWAYCFWAIHARIQAERDKPVRGAQKLVERIYKYSGLSTEDQLDKRVMTVMERLGDRYAERLGLSHEEIMKGHQEVRS